MPSASLRLAAPPPSALFLQEALEGLRQSQKTLPCKYLYDARGSRLFDRITTLDAYYPTRTETAIMERHGDEMAALLGDGVNLIEYGSGSSVKTRLLLDRLRPAAYVPIDISRAHLLASAARLAGEHPDLHILPVVADYTQPFTLPDMPGTRNAVYFPGSTIGNFDPDEAAGFLAEIARVAGQEGGLLIGVDLRKDAATLERAYDDEEGVTAAFNLNLLIRINRELGGDFDPACFRHHARWNAILGRVEMHLVSVCDQVVHVGGEVFRFREGETIHTENSYKYTLADFSALAARAGFRVTHVWTDDEARFSVQYAEVVGP